MRDRFGRPITYLRVSVTDRCNLRCYYCMPDGFVPLPREQLLSFEEIAEVVRLAVRLGIWKVRLTGGEPLVRRGVVELVRMLSGIEGIRELTMTTNGTLLAEHAKALAAAGLRRVNVSLDAVRPGRYAAITGGGEVGRVLAGIEAARRAGLEPVKLNCVVRHSSSEPDARDVARYAAERGLEVRFIRMMHPARGLFWPVEGGAGGECARCNRLRLTATGLIKPCLLSDMAFSVRAMGAEAALRRAILEKPARGGVCAADSIRISGG